LDLEEGKVYALKSVKVSDYGGRSINIGDDHADIFKGEDINDPNVAKMVSWFRGFSGETSVKLTTGGGTGKATKVCTIAEMTAHCERSEFMQTDDSKDFFRIFFKR